MLLKRDALREKLEELNNDIKVGKITCYEDFEIIKGDKNHNAFMEKNVFIVAREKEENGKKIEYYELYDGKQNLIGSTDENGELQYSKEFKEKLGPMASRLDLEERKMHLNKDEEFTVDGKSKEELDPKEKEEKQEKEKIYKEHKLDNVEPALIEDDLGIDRNSISYCDAIKDKRFSEMVPESKDFSSSAMLIYSNKTKEFMVVGIKDGKFQKYNSINPAKSVVKDAKNLGKDGDNIETKSIGGILEFKDKRDSDFAVNIEPTGNVKLQELRRDLNTGKMIASDLETDAQYKANWKVEEMMKKTKKENISNEIQNVEELEEKKIVKLEDVKEEDKEANRQEEEYEKVPWDRNPRGFRSRR